MLKRLVTFALGKWGMAVLRFYIANSMWINAVVIAYMLVLTISYVNYRNTKNKVMELLKFELEAHPRKKKFSFSSELLELKKPLLPLISGKVSFFPRRYSIQKIEDLLDSDPDINKLRADIKIKIT